MCGFKSASPSPLVEVGPYYDENEKDMLEESPVKTETKADAEVTAETDAEDVEAGEVPYEWKEPPLFDVAEKDDCLVDIKVTIPVANIRAAMDDVYDEVNDGVQVPGFRRGKAPRKLLEKRLGKYVRSTVVERLVEPFEEPHQEKPQAVPGGC